MRTKLFFLVLALSTIAFADNDEKAQKKALEEQAKTLLSEAKDLQKSGQLVEAKARYAASLAFKDSKDAGEAIKHIDEQLHQQVKDALRQAHSFYDRGQFQQAAEELEKAAALGNSTAAVAFNLALCFQRLNQTAKALAYLEQAAEASPDPRHKLKLKQLATSFTTGETSGQQSDSDRDRISAINRLVEGLGFDSTLRDAQSDDEDENLTEAPDSKPAVPFASAALRSNVPTVPVKPAGSLSKQSGLCDALAQMKGPVSETPALTFDLANCDEDNGRLTEAAAHLDKYLATVPNAADAPRVGLRVASLNALVNLPGESGTQVRSLFSTAARSIQERSFDRALAAFQKAAKVLPEFPPTQWKLALLNEAMGNVDQAKSHFTRYQQLQGDPLAQQEADLHLASLDAKKEKYAEEVEAADDILANLLNRAMNLTFNGLKDRRAVKAHRARLKGKQARKDSQKLGGFAIPSAYVRQQLTEAAEHLATALTVFPLGAEANQLMAQVYLQANDGRAAMRAFDTVISQGLPAAFYAEMRGRRQDRAVKCELTSHHVRLIFLSYYDNGRVVAPAFPAGEDGLGDLAIDPSLPREQKFESIELGPAEIKKVESKTGIIRLKLTKEDLTLSVMYLSGPPPVEGPQARRFSNIYARLFVRYPGLEDSRLGNEGLTGGEKFKLAYHLANAGFTIATSMNPMGSFTALKAFIDITREIQQTRNSLKVNFAGWEKTIEDQQELQGGNAFKMIPTEPAALTFTEETK
ncbi:MAG TPA: tetratricopeptide repeat protein [Candidatus Angelobacter sp.]|nr:tetratricopeptide repeat protein [Candidatus Angelobacter sp.]